MGGKTEISNFIISKQYKDAKNRSMMETLLLTQDESGNTAMHYAY
jgi:hypothetical protein